MTDADLSLLWAVTNADGPRRGDVPDDVRSALQAALWELNALQRSKERNDGLLRRIDETLATLKRTHEPDHATIARLTTERDQLRARVAELEAAAPPDELEAILRAMLADLAPSGFSPGDAFLRRMFGYVNRAWELRIVELRSVNRANEECDRLRSEVSDRTAGSMALARELDARTAEAEALRARVAELEADADGTDVDAAAADPVPGIGPAEAERPCPAADPGTPPAPAGPDRWQSVGAMAALGASAGPTAGRIGAAESPPGIGAEDRDRLKARVAELESADPDPVACAELLGIDPGRKDITLRHWAVPLMARSFAEFLGSREDAPNYRSVCVDVISGDGDDADRMRLEVIVRRAEGKTPSEVSRELRAEVERLRAAVAEHHRQKADDRCWEDDDRLYAAFGLPACDRRVGDPAAMLENCARFIQGRCEGGGPWASYADLEAQRDELLAALEAILEVWRREGTWRDFMFAGRVAEEFAGPCEAAGELVERIRRGAGGRNDG